MTFKKNALLFTGILMAATLAFTGCNKKAEEKKEEQVAESTTEDMTQIANPWSDLTSLAEAEGLTGFKYGFPESLLDGKYVAKEFRAMKVMLEIIYQGEDEDDIITIRQTPGEGMEIDGDYTEYSHDFEDEIAKIPMRFRGTKNKIFVTNFSYADNSYAMLFANGITVDDVENIIQKDFLDADGGSAVNQNGMIEIAARKIDEKAMDEFAMGGEYVGNGEAKCELNIYTNVEAENDPVGNISITNIEGKEVVSGELVKVTDNFYRVTGMEANITFYTENDNVCFDLYINGAHANDFWMTKHAKY